jgi:hypothetical protein
MAIKCTTPEFIEKAKSLKYDYSLVNYTVSKANITIICPIHGEFLQKADGHIQGAGCQQCSALRVADSNRGSLEEFIVKAVKVHGDKYDYSKIVYTNSLVKVPIICKLHGVFLQSPSQHLSYGCVKCRDVFNSVNLKDSQEEFIDKALKVHGSKYDYSLVNYVKSNIKIEIVCSDHGAFYQKPYSHLNGRGCKSCSTVGPSNGEIELSCFVSSLVETTLSDRTVIKPFELDCFAPSKKLGIEFCGIYYHSDRFRDANYHLNKHELATEAGYGIIQVFDDEWSDKKEIVKSIIKNRLSLTDTITYARKTTIKIVPLKEAKTFLKNNHLQGYANAEILLGLYQEGELLTIATFSKKRRVLGSMPDDWYELVRLCTRINTSVVGGFSKLIKHFMKTYSPNGIKTFCDRRYFNGLGYKTVGFIESHISKPNYFYVKQGVRYSRYQFQKHKLKKLLSIYDENISEKENMVINGYSRIYDCGNVVFTMLMR